jgi:hypothetical protein
MSHCQRLLEDRDKILTQAQVCIYTSWRYFDGTIHWLADDIENIHNMGTKVSYCAALRENPDERNTLINKIRTTLTPHIVEDYFEQIGKLNEELRARCNPRDISKIIKGVAEPSKLVESLFRKPEECKLIIEQIHTTNKWLAQPGSKYDFINYEIAMSFIDQILKTKKSNYFKYCAVRKDMFKPTELDIPFGEVESANIAVEYIDQIRKRFDHTEDNRGEYNFNNFDCKDKELKDKKTYTLFVRFSQGGDVVPSL